MAQTASRFATVAVDVRPLREKGIGTAYAESVRAALADELLRVYADRIGGTGPRLVVRVDAVSMGSYAGGGSGRFGVGGGTPNDYMDGEASIVGRHGEIIARRRQLSAVPASSGGAWYDPASEARRIGALAAHFAGWLRRSDL